MATIIIKNSTGSGAVPPSLTQGELAINVVDGKLFYGSGSGNIVKEFTGSGVSISASYALTASYAANGGVTQLLAGPNISLSPTTGIGQVTISSTGDGGGGFNTATGSYGSFYDTTTQTNPVANIPRSMSFNSTDITNGVSISGSTSPFNTYIKTENAGVYNIQFSAQLDKTDGGSDEIVIWLRKNGINLTDTSTTITLTSSTRKQVAAWNWFVNSAANDYYQIIWTSADTNVRLLAEPADGHPGIPSVILTANRVDQFLSNTGSFSGSFNGVFTGSFSGSGIITSASYAATASLAPLYLPLAGGTISGNVTVLGTASINTLIVNQIGYSSGSNQLGDAANDTQTLFGTVRIPTGSLTVTGSLIVSGGVDVTGNSLFRGQVSTTTGFYISSTGAALNFYGGTTGTSNSYVFNTYGSTNNVASNNFVNISRTYDPTSGTGVYNMLLLEPTINQTGGANGITRGLYVNPTLTSFIDFRAIENVRGNNLLNSTSGNTYIGLSSNAGTARLQVRGSGTTSATTALRVENTNASASLVVLDNGNVGIGTTTPTKRLEIYDSASGDGLSVVRNGVPVQRIELIPNDDTASTLIKGGGNNKPFYIASWANGGTAQPLYFGTNYSSGISQVRMTIDTTGSVGIGTLTPSARLHISASDSSSAYSFLVQNSLGQVLFSSQNDRTVNINSTNTAGGDTTIGTTNGSVIFNQGYNNRFRGNSINFYSGGDASTIQGWTGNPGIAVGYAQSNSNPNTGSAFTVRGTVASSGSGVLFVTGSSATRLLTIASETSSSILVVSGSGNVGIGTSSPAKALTVQANSNDEGILLRSSTGNTLFQATRDGASNNTAEMFLYSGGAIRLAIRSTSNFSYFNGGNFGFGTATDLSARLGIRGSGATNATTAFLVQNSTPTTLFQIQDHGSSSFAGNMSITGSVRITGSAGLTVIGSGSTVLDIQGSQGQLFSITDSLSGSLFSVNDISGLPILEVFSDNTTLIGDYQDPMLITTKKVTMTNSGSFVVYSLPTASYDTAFFDYSIKSGSNARAGQIMAIQSGSSVNFTETTTTDFGNTTAVSFTVIVSGSNMVLTGSAATGSWTIKSIIRGL